MCQVLQCESNRVVKCGYYNLEPDLVAVTESLVKELKVDIASSTDQQQHAEVQHSIKMSMLF